MCNCGSGRTIQQIPAPIQTRIISNKRVHT